MPDKLACGSCGYTEFEAIPDAGDWIMLVCARCETEHDPNIPNEFANYA